MVYIECVSFLRLNIKFKYLFVLLTDRGTTIAPNQPYGYTNTSFAYNQNVTNGNPQYASPPPYSTCVVSGLSGRGLSAPTDSAVHYQEIQHVDENAEVNRYM